MMDNTPILLLGAAVIGLVGLAIGAAIGLILSGMRNPSSHSDQDRKGLVEAARLWRNPRSGNLSVEINGKVFASHSELSSAQRTSLNRAIDELELWLGNEGLPERISAVSQLQPAAEQLQPSPRSAALQPKSPAPLTKTGSTPSLPQQPRLGQAGNIRPPSLNVGDILSQAINPPERSQKNPEVPQTIAGQVDIIVQELLPHSALSGRTIQLHDSPDGGIVVWVDGRKFTGISEVDDAEVRAFLQRCASEWEQKYG